MTQASSNLATFNRQAAPASETAASRGFGDESGGGRMISARNLSAFGFSVGFHAVVLAAMWLYRFELQQQHEIVVETVLSKERTMQEISQELEAETEVAETANPIAASSSFDATNVSGGAGSLDPSQSVEQAESLNEPTMEIAAAPLALPGDSELDTELGEGVVQGGMEVAAGYQPALARITQELLRMMRQSRVHVVWLFDESDSMKDDQEQISANFHKVYEELGIQLRTDEQLSKQKEVLWTTIQGFGKGVHPITARPTTDINEIRAAIDRIPVDESGEENVCQALIQTLEKFGEPALKGGRKLVIIVVADESGDDGRFDVPKGPQRLEGVVERARRFKSPIYVLGREAVFGYPYARIRWTDPKYGLDHWLQIHRGPETAYPECLQWNGFHHRWDVFASGFGPYEQMRIARESGGIFFMLPGEEENLVGHGANQQRKFDFLDMKEYEPLLESHRAYEQKRRASPFRQSIWNIIVTLNPHLDEKLVIQHWHYSMNPAEFRRQGLAEAQKAKRAVGLVNNSLSVLKEVRPLRERESFRRWQANYDLLYAQLLNYRVRLFQYLLALDRHANHPPKPQDPKSNEWRIYRVKEMIEPDEAQFNRLKRTFKLEMTRDELLETMRENYDRSRKLYQFVIKEHPGTPWARRAARELQWGYGMTFRDHFYDPRYYKARKEIKLPNP